MIRRIGMEDGRDYWQCTLCNRRWISSGRPQFEHVCTIIAEGPGSVFSRMAAALGFRECSECTQLKLKMNEMGPDECMRAFDALVEDICTRVNLPLAEVAVRAMLWTAIEQSKTLECKQ